MFLNIAIKLVYFIVSLFLETFSHRKVSKRRQFRVNFFENVPNQHLLLRKVYHFLIRIRIDISTKKKIKFYKVRHKK